MNEFDDEDDEFPGPDEIVPQDDGSARMLGGMILAGLLGFGAGVLAWLW